MTLLERCFHPRLISDLKRRAANGVYFYLIMTLVVLLEDGYYHRHADFSRYFISLMVGACAMRLLFMAVDRFVSSSRVTAVLFVGSALVCSLAWGVGFAEITILDGESRTRFLMTICTIGLCSGGMMAYSPSLRLCAAYLFCLLAPAVLAIWTQGGDQGLAHIILTAATYLMITAHRANREYWQAVDTEFLLAERTRELEQMNRKDGLTGLKNRQCFDQALELEWKRVVRRPAKLSLLMCDVDHFKMINDRYGHLCGDEYLKETARILTSVFRRDTDVVARYGGEEFVVLMPDTPMDQALAKAEEVRDLVEKNVLEYEGKRVTTTVSIGAAGISMGIGGSKETLVAMADHYLYEAKNSGRNRVMAAP